MCKIVNFGGGEVGPQKENLVDDPGRLAPGTFDAAPRGSPSTLRGIPLGPGDPLAVCAGWAGAACVFFEVETKFTGCMTYFYLLLTRQKSIVLSS